MEIRDNQNKIYDEIVKVYNEFWKGLPNIPNVGSLYPQTKTLQEEMTNIQNLLSSCIKNQTTIFNYTNLINTAYLKSVTKLFSEKEITDPSSKLDVKKFRGQVIDVFEESFTELFKSKEFATTVSELISNYSDINKIIETIFTRYSKLLNLPDKNEMNEALKDIQELKREMHDLRKNLETTSNEGR